MTYKLIYYFSFLMLCISCNSNINSEENIPRQIERDERIPYSNFIIKVTDKRKQLKNADADKINHYFFSLVNNDIPDYWTGTSWDFNGTTRIPQKGNIACGYFVTNTLSDLGFDIQRIKLAQVASSQMIKQLCVDVKTIAGFERFQQYMNAQPMESVFIVGLDFHTGYILKDASGIYFLHSNYIQRKGVTKERIEDSEALKNSKTYFVGSLSKNKKLLMNWVNY